MRVYNTLSQQQGGVRPARAGQGRDVRVRADGLQPHPHRQRAHVPLLRRDPALPRVQGLRRHASSRTSPTSTTRSSTGPTKRAAPPPRWPQEYTDAFISAMRRARHRGPDGAAQGHRDDPRDDRADRAPHRGRARVRVDGDVYFAVRSFPGYGKLSGRDIDEMETQARVDARRAQARPARLRAVEVGQARRAALAEPVGRGPSRLAHRVLGDVGDGARPALRHPRRRQRPRSSRTTRTRSRSPRRRPASRSRNYWLHGGMLQVNAEKMSKSLGNFMLAQRRARSATTRPSSGCSCCRRTTAARSTSPTPGSRRRRTPTSASPTSCATCAGRATSRRAGWASRRGASTGSRPPIAAAREKFDAEMDDDFNTAGALGGDLRARARRRTASSRSTRWTCARTTVSCCCEAEETVVVALLGVLGIEIADDQTCCYPARGRRSGRRHRRLQGRRPGRRRGRAAGGPRRGACREGLGARRRGARRAGALGFAIEDTPQGARVIFEPQA